MESAEAIARLITEWRAGISDQARRFDATRRAIDEVSVTETAVGGAIVLTVDSSGIPTDLRLGDDIGRMKPGQVAGQIMACLRRAQARLADRVGVVVAGTLGDAAGATEVVEQYQYRFPPPSDVEDVPLAPLEENADFGLSAMDMESTPSPTGPGAPVQDQPDVAARRRRHVPARDAEDEDWDAPPW